jgi:hypothetical protein
MGTRHQRKDVGEKEREEQRVVLKDMCWWWWWCWWCCWYIMIAQGIVLFIKKIKTHTRSYIRTNKLKMQGEGGVVIFIYEKNHIPYSIPEEQTNERRREAVILKLSPNLTQEQSFI